MPPPPAHIHLTAGGAPRRLPARCRPRGEALPQSGCGAVAATWSRAGREVSAAGQRLHLAGGGGGPGRGCGTLGPGLLSCGLPFLSLVPLSVSVVAGSDGGERNKGEPGDLPKSERASEQKDAGTLRAGIPSLRGGRLVLSHPQSALPVGSPSGASAGGRVRRPATGDKALRCCGGGVKARPVPAAAEPSAGRGMLLPPRRLGLRLAGAGLSK